MKRPVVPASGGSPFAGSQALEEVSSCAGG
jgi:hypothetical protein